MSYTDEIKPKGWTRLKTRTLFMMLQDAGCKPAVKQLVSVLVSLHSSVPGKTANPSNTPSVEWISPTAHERWPRRSADLISSSLVHYWMLLGVTGCLMNRSNEGSVNSSDQLWSSVGLLTLTVTHATFFTLFSSFLIRLWCIAAAAVEPPLLWLLSSADPPPSFSPTLSWLVLPAACYHLIFLPLPLLTASCFLPGCLIKGALSNEITPWGLMVWLIDRHTAGED